MNNNYFKVYNLIYNIENFLFYKLIIKYFFILKLSFFKLYYINK